MKELVDDLLDVDDHHGAVDGPNLGGCYSLSRAYPHLSGSSRPAGNERSSANEFEADCHPPLSINCHPKYTSWFLLSDPQSKLSIADSAG